MINYLDKEIFVIELWFKVNKLADIANETLHCKSIDEIIRTLDQYTKQKHLLSKTEVKQKIKYRQNIITLLLCLDESINYLNNIKQQDNTILQNINQLKIELSLLLELIEKIELVPELVPESASPSTPASGPALTSAAAPALTPAAAQAMRLAKIKNNPEIQKIPILDFSKIPTRFSYLVSNLRFIRNTLKDKLEEIDIRYFLELANNYYRKNDNFLPETYYNSDAINEYLKTKKLKNIDIDLDETKIQYLKD